MSEGIRLYNIMNVDKSTLYMGEERATLVTEYICFKTKYINHIPIIISKIDFDLVIEQKKKFINKKETPILFDIRKQAIKYLKDTHAFKD